LKNAKIKKSKGKKTGFKIFKACILTFLILGIIGCFVTIGIVTGILDDTDVVDINQLKNMNLSSTIYSKDGVVLAKLYASENRDVVKLKDVPLYLKDAIISIEDERFYTHYGVDIKRTAAAIKSYIVKRTRQ